ncbi:hypothetical protein QVD17_02840 [Tagetes erecta]|uniref:Protein BIC1 n=1 Tax=Tagetes erecta TaxID=13708 RepID=A0AAD8P2T5_TARER|nr:hypothetical protein QVD17_02840 [Tagetes erecta]
MDTNKNPNLQTTTHHVPLSSSQLLNTNNTISTTGGRSSTSTADGVDTRRSVHATTTRPAEESGREKLKKHRVEMSGRVWIPEIWGQEDLLKEWVDCTVFDSSLKNKSIMSARTALVHEARSTVKIDNRC